MLEDKYKLTQLFDFYGELLTAKQKAVLACYLEADLALVEIAENLGISRQAVYDHVHKATALLSDYENKLGLLSRFEKQNQLLSELHQKLNELDCDLKTKEKLSLQIEKIIEF